MNITRKQLAALMLAPVVGLAAFLAPGLATAASASPAPVAKVTGLRVTTAATTSLSLAWTAPADKNAKVRIQVSDPDTLADTWDSAYKGGDVTGTAVTATGLAAGTAYVLRADESDGTANSGWTAPVTVYTQASGAAGAAGPAGPAGPSGVVSVTTKDLGAVASVPTGGSFSTGKTLVGTISLKAGTYLVSVNAKATPDVSSAVGVFPQFFVYDGAALADFSNDLFNVGSGALATLNTTIDSYYSGTGVITLAADSTIDLYAFGYDSDRSAGTYALDDLAVTAVQLQAAS